MAPLLVPELDAAAGGRLASLTVDGVEVLVGRDPHPMLWGCYPMVPFAGRLGYGRFTFAGREYAVPCNLGEHAIHGYGYTSAWEREPDGSLALELGPPWPFGGTARQRIDVDSVEGAATLTWVLSVANDARTMPAQVGWHPWFVKPAALHFAPGAMYERGRDGLPTGRLLRPVPPGPWDDCFTDVREPIVLTFTPQGRSPISLELRSSCDHWVVYDEPGHATCVEPQSGPPDAFNRAPFVVEPGQPLVATMSITARLAGT